MFCLLLLLGYFFTAILLISHLANSSKIQAVPVKIWCVAVFMSPHCLTIWTVSCQAIICRKSATVKKVQAWFCVKFSNHRIAKFSTLLNTTAGCFPLFIIGQEINFFEYMKVKEKVSEIDIWLKVRSLIMDFKMIWRCLRSFVILSVWWLVNTKQHKCIYTEITWNPCFEYEVMNKEA